MATALDFKVAASFTGKVIVLDLPIPTGMKSQFFKTHFGPENDQSLYKKKKKKTEKLDEELKEIHQSNYKDNKYWKNGILSIVQERVWCHVKQHQQ